MLPPVLLAAFPDLDADGGGGHPATSLVFQCEPACHGRTGDRSLDTIG
jgi:hypothetical protein